MNAPKIRGTIHCVLHGGPLDGARYGDAPDPRKEIGAARLSIPLSQPHEQAARAVYICPEPGERGEPWEFHFQKIELPGLPVGTSITFANKE